MKKLLVVASACLVLSACGSDSKQSAGGGGNTIIGLNNNTTNGTYLVSGKTLANNLLGGTWASTCETDTDGSIVNGSHLEYYTFYNDGIALYSTNFSDGNCQTPELAVFAYINGTATSNEDNDHVFTASFPATAIGSTSYIPLSAAIAKEFNDSTACGNSQWQVNQPFKVDGTSCAFDGATDGQASSVTFTVSADNKTLSLASCDTAGKKMGQCDAVIELQRSP